MTTKFIYAETIPIMLLIASLIGCQNEKADEGIDMVYNDGDEPGGWCMGDVYISESNTGFCLSAGRVEMIPTWSNQDRAYKLYAKKTVLSTYWLDDTQEIQVGFMAKKEGDATLKIHFDYFEMDYLVENEPIEPAPLKYKGIALNPTVRETVTVKVKEVEDWKHFEITHEPPPWADLVGVHIVKQGPGSITLSQLILNWPVFFSSKEYHNLKKTCEDDKTCGDGFCTEIDPPGSDTKARSVCSMCRTDEHCDAPSICGSDGYFRSCVYPAVKPLGAPCAVDDECTNGYCCDGQCAACCQDDDCDGECVKPAPWEPYQCDPGEGDYNVGDVCYRDQDCASGYCESQSVKNDYLTIQTDYFFSCTDEPEEACQTTILPYGQCAETE